MKSIHKPLFTIFLFLQSFYLFAQESPFQFGVKTGVNLYTISMEVSGISRKVKPGHHFGLTAEYRLNENEFYLQTGVDYITKGAMLKKIENLEGGTHEWSQSLNMQYIQVPLMGVYKMEMDSELKVYFRAGPYAAFGIGGKTTQKDKYKGVDKEDVENKQDSFGKNKLKDFDLGIRFGSGLEFEKFTIGLDFEYGLIDINQKTNELGTIFNDKSVKNRGLTLSLGYKF